MEQALKGRICKKMEVCKTRTTVNLPSLHHKRYVKSFSMEELSSMAREICSTKNKKPFYQVGLEYTFERTGSFENICRSSQEKTEHKQNYHSWPKTSLQKKKYRKHMRRISRENRNSLTSDIIESNQETSVDPRLARNYGETVRRSDGMKFFSCLFYNASEIGKRDNETASKFKVVMMDNTFSQSTGLLESTEQHNSITKIVKEMHPKSSLSLPVLPSDKKDDSGLFYHEYWPESQCLSPFLVVDKVDNDKQLNFTDSFPCDAKSASYSDELQDNCQEMRNDGIPYRCRSKSAPIRDSMIENVSAHVKQSESKICKGKEQSLKCKCVSHQIKMDLGDRRKCSKLSNSYYLTGEAEGKNIPGRESTDFTVTRLGKFGKKHRSRSLELLTQGGHWTKKREIESCLSQKVAALHIGTQAGTSAPQVQTKLPTCGSSAHEGTDELKLEGKDKASYPLLRNVTEESSESSDSGVGNIKYDIIMKNWNEPVVKGPLFKKRLEVCDQLHILMLRLWLPVLGIW